jgi:hypothetical protein
MNGVKMTVQKETDLRAKRVECHGTVADINATWSGFDSQSGMDTDSESGSPRLATLRTAVCSEYSAQVGTRKTGPHD